MTIKRAIAIGTLSAITITLIAFGIKTKSFKPKTTTPFAQHRSAIRVDAENLYPVSNKWLINNNIPTTTQTFQQNINFTSKPNYTNTIGNQYTQFTYSKPQTWIYRLSYYSNASIKAYERYEGTPEWIDSGYRIVDFETQPNGNLYTWLNTNARPCYNNDVLLVNRQIATGLGSSNTNPNVINEIRKASLQIEPTSYLDGTMINETGTIQIFLDAGTSQLIINGTDYTSNLNGSINITNNDIRIATYGTRSGNTSYVFTINYFNTRPPIDPQPYPDPGEQVVEVVEIMPMMFKILTMPFTFISQAFNVTLWEGTPYEFNFSNFILSLISIATLLFIIKLFTSGFSIIGNYSANHESRALKRSQTKLNNAKTQQIKNGTKDKPSKKG